MSSDIKKRKLTNTNIPSKVKAATSNDTQTSSSDVDSRINLQTTEFNVRFFLI